MRSTDRSGLVGLLWALVALCCLVSLASAGRHAYVTIVGTDDYVVGARVLGASLKATGTQKEMIAVVLQYVSVAARFALQEQGWKVIVYPQFHNPFHDDHIGFSKLALWSLREYDRLVYLDADNFVQHNIDDLFKCGALFCGAMGRDRPRQFDFDTGVLVIKPSKNAFEQLLSTAAALAKAGHVAEADFLNVYFENMCSFKRPPTSLKSLDYEPPVWKGETTGSDCYQLDHRFNWQWGADLGDSLLGMHEQDAAFHPDVSVVHFAGKNIKPWDWRGYPLHGWIIYWQTYASKIPNLIPLSSYVLYYFPPVVVLLLASIVSTSSRLDGIFKPSTLEKMAKWNTIPFGSFFPVFAKYLTIWSWGGIPMITVPYLLYTSRLLPSIVPPLLGWLLFFCWTAMLYWFTYGPYVLYHYLLGRAFAANRLKQSNIQTQLVWLRGTPCFIPRRLSVLAASVLHSIAFAILGYTLIFLLAFFPWSSPKTHLLTIVGFWLVFLPLLFGFWGAGLPRHAFLSGYRERAGSVAADLVDTEKHE